jgi:hypothetical protein
MLRLRLRLRMPTRVRAIVSPRRSRHDARL